MDCTQCGVTNEPSRRFCKECGARLALSCPSCGAGNAPSDKFCGDCGTALTGRVAPADPSARGAGAGHEGDTERRLVSVLFVDLVGFTTFSEKRDAEDVRAMLTHYFEASSDAVQRHGGTVEKFIGDAVMAVWGTPVAHEDDAERAVRSALEIVDRVAALGTGLGLDLQARAGVLTGEAIAVLDAVDQGFVTGDLVNTASRLQSAAAPGTVLVGERTYRSISESIACVPVEPLSLKGKAEQLPAWLAQRVISEMGGSNRGSAPEPPFGGRDEELRLAKELLHATGREGRPRLLHVTGVAGIGKSRLVWELQKYVDGLTEVFLWHQGRCPSYGDGVTFWALAEMVRGRARIADTDDDATARSALAACLEDYVPDLEERRWIEPRLGHLIGLEGTSGDRDELFGAWRRFFERVAEQGTTVLVFEDIHWADSGLLDFVESLLEWSRTSPVIVLSLARPELSDRRPTWGSGVRSSSTLHLDRLTDSDIETMVTGYVDGLPDEGLARLVSRAEGVPMYAVETVRMLAGRGVLEQTGGTYVVVGDLGGELDIPETLHALVAARLDGLPDAERALVQDAAVAGHSFTLAGVAAVAGRSAEELEPLLRTLVRKEVLDQDVDPRSAERGQYRFVQSVIQEVAYSTLSKSARRSKHVACARWLESLDEDELAGVVASHYLEAYRSEPGAADADEIADHARLWLTRAGDWAASLGSPEQAYAFAVQALSLASSPPDVAALHVRAALSASSAGNAEAMWEHAIAASAEHRRLGDPAAETQMFADLAVFGLTTEQRAELNVRLREAESRLGDDHPAEHVSALSALSVQAVHRGDLDQALTLSERALIVAQTIDAEGTLRRAALARAFALHSSGRHFEAGVLLDGVVAMARRSGSPIEQSRALMNFGNMLWEDDPRAALAAMLESADLAGRAGDRPLQGLALANASEGAFDLGAWDEAEKALTDVASLNRDRSVDDAGAALTTAMLTAYRGDASAALAALAELDTRKDLWESVPMRTWFLRSRAVCRFLALDAPGASDDAAASIDLDASGINAGPTLWIGIQAASARRDAAAIESVLRLTAGIRGRWTELVRGTAHAAVAAITEGQDAPAMTASALDAWVGADLPLDHALATLCALQVLPRDDVPHGHVVRARTYLEELKAVTLLRLYEATLS